MCAIIFVFYEEHIILKVYCGVGDIKGAEELNWKLKIKMLEIFETPRFWKRNLII